jgi:hypothetical protein
MAARGFGSLGVQGEEMTFERPCAIFLTLTLGISLEVKNMRAFIVTAALAALLAPAAALAQPAPPAECQSAKHYSTACTTAGALMDDAKAKAVVDKYIPGLMEEPGMEQGRILTLKAMQQYDSNRITDLALTNIDLDLAKLPIKK